MCNCEFTNCSNICNQLWSCQMNECVKNDFQWNVSNDIFLLLCIFFINILASISGIGGGGLLIPLYILLGNFNISYAIPHTVLNIAAGSLIRFVILFNRRHTLNSRRYLIDFTILFILVPFDGNLSYFGYVLNKMLPDYITLLSILIILTFVSYKTFSKFKKQYIIEKNIQIKEIELNKIYTIDGISTMIHDQIDINIDGLDLNIDRKSYLLIKRWFSSMKSGENKKTRYMYLLCTFFLSVLFFTFSYFRKNLETCSNLFYIHMCSQLIVTSLISLLFSYYVYKNYIYRKKNNFLFLKGDINWNYKILIKFILFATFTGIISTYLGIGGGMLITPFLLTHNVLPEVVVATNSISTFFSSSISTSQYIFTGKILFKYGIYTSLLSMFGSYLGLKLSHHIMKKFKRKSFITFILFIIVLTSEILLIISNWNIEMFNQKIKNFC